MITLDGSVRLVKEKHSAKALIPMVWSKEGQVIPEDVRAVCYEVLRHRIGLTYEAEAENMTTDQIISEIINAVEVP